MTNRTMKGLLFTLFIIMTISVACECQRIYDNRVSEMKDQIEHYVEINNIAPGYMSSYRSELDGCSRISNDVKIAIIKLSKKQRKTFEDSILLVDLNRTYIESIKLQRDTVKVMSSMLNNKKYYFIFDKNITLTKVYSNNKFKEM